MHQVPLHESWNHHLSAVFQTPYMKALEDFLKREHAQKKTIYPNTNEVFAALNATPFDQVKVVILGQDPYHGCGQAHGLSFSVRQGTVLPPSLQNIYKELRCDLNCQPPNSGDLSFWADQGVLLLNSVLTVEAGKAGSHKQQGWEKFTDDVISKLNFERDHLVFILWGSYAQKKGKMIDSQRHLILKSPHPSPLSSYRGFFGSKPFSKTNDYLLLHGLKPITWAQPTTTLLQ